MTLPLIGVFVSLAFLITLAYRGHSVIVVAPIAASIAVLFSGAPLMATYTQIFMPALAGFLANFFPLFIVGAIFGKLMSVSGLAQDLANGMSRVLGPQRALLVTVLATSVLTYGGVSAWVVVFTMFPIAMSLFRLADIPRRLMPAAIALGIFTFTTAALPGSPQIHNTIPTRFFDTNTFAAPGLGLLGGAAVFTLGMMWLNYRKRQLMAAGESFTDQTEAERKAAPGSGGGQGSGSAGTVTETMPEVREATTTRTLLGLLPVVVVIGMNALCTYAIFPAMDFEYLAEERYGSTSITTVGGTWAVVLAMLTSILVIFALKPRAVKEFIEGLSTGAKNAVVPAFTTASEVAYGAVIASLAVFAIIRDWIFGLSDNAVVVSILSTSGISGLTGSASGGLTITLETFGEQLRTMADAEGISMDLMHRTTAMASTGLDSLPHNGAIITLLLVCGLSHRESYKDIGVVTVLVPLVGLALVAGVGLAIATF